MTQYDSIYNEVRIKEENRRNTPVPINVAFDIDDTLYRVHEAGKCQVPDFKLMPLLFWFVENGDNVYLWSAGGCDYALMIAMKFGIEQQVKILRKGSTEVKMDLVFDDEAVQLGKTNVKIDRNRH